jgi:hypothetical protein
MLALYRAGRQSEALDTYRAAREALVEELGIEPAPPLRELERAILTQDPSLDLSAPAEEARALLAVPSSGSALLTIAAPLAEGQWSDFIVARLVAEEADVEKAVLELAAASPSDARVAALTTADPAAEVVRLATAYDVELVLLDLSSGLEDEQLPSELAAVLERSPADVAVLTGPVGAGGNGVFVPFGGGEHDWAALELGARLAVSIRSATAGRDDGRPGKRPA